MSDPLPPAIKHFVDTVCQAIDTFSDSVEIGCHVNHDSEVCELSVFPLTQEIVGGPDDGRQLKPAFSLDVMPVVLAFEQVNSVRWQNAPFADDDELGNHIVVEGEIDGQQVWVNMLAQAPDRFETQPVDGLGHKV